MEPMDISQLNEAEETILEPGGEIFFVLEDDSVVGTCAMVPHGVGCYELAKMAVVPQSQGKGYGVALMMTAMAWARQKGAKQILILSNTLLNPAISLYKKHGFE